MNWPFWLEVLARSSALLLAGEVLRRLSKSQTAAFRHRFLLSVFALLALLPVLSALLPQFPLPLWSATHQRQTFVTIEEISSTPLQTAHPPSLNWPLIVWFTGALLTSTPLFIGSVAAWKIARRAKPFAAPLRPATTTPILLSTELATPLTCGLFRSRILLPAAAETWTPARLEAVLLHELAHVRRRDVAAQIAVHLIAALWWFQPLVWILRRTLRAESELACDAQALQSGFRPSTYAAELLALAQTLGRHQSFSSSAIPMAHSHDLERRVQAILAPPTALLRPIRTYTLALSLAPLALAASALSLQPNPTSNQSGGSIMKQTFLSALLTSVSLSAATVTGTISDPTGAALSDVKVLVYNPDTGTRQETVTGSDGKFSFADTPAGQFILRAEKPGFVSLFREFDLNADSNVARAFTMAAQGVQSAPDKILSDDSEQPRRVRVGGNVMSNNLVAKVQPVYPPAAKAAGTQGMVQIEATISKEGVPVELRVLASPSDDLSQASLEAVRQWRYRPTLLNGSPVEVETSIIINYSLAR